MAGQLAKTAGQDRWQQSDVESANPKVGRCLLMQNTVIQAKGGCAGHAQGVG